MKIEICASSYQSAVNAEIAGAHRIELCSELALGGITPSYGLLSKVLASLSIPVFVLIRPRGGDFCYSEDELEIMKEDIRICKQLGAAGIVSGVLKKDFSIDIERTKMLMDIAGSLSFTFHRAFDWVPNPLEELLNLENLGVHRVLTSGQKTNVVLGLENLKSFKKASTNIKILPGGGVNETNILLFKKHDFKEVHFTANKFHKTIEHIPISINSPKHYDEQMLAISDISIIKNCLQILTNES